MALTEAPKWFDASVYMANKLTQVKIAEPDSNWTAQSLADAFVASGFTGVNAAYDHFVQYGMTEDVAPNTFFNANEYYAAKAAQFYHKGDVKAVTALDVANIKGEIHKAGMNAWSHYEAYGSSEGVNPSNAFDGDAYIAAKATIMGKTPEFISKAFSDAHMSALEHFLIYGGQGKDEITPEQVKASFPVAEKDQVTPDAGTGQTFTLTTEKDTIQGDVQDNTFLAAPGGPMMNVNTFTPEDSLDGGAGNDTLVLNGQGTVIAGVQTVKNIENLKVYQNGIWTGDVSEFAGLQNVAITAPGAVTLTAGASVTNVALNGAVGAVGLTGNGIANVSVHNMAAADQTLTVNNTTAKHTLNVTLDKVGTVNADGTAKTVLTITDAAAETIALTSNGVENAVLIGANAALKNVTIEGKGDLALNANAAATLVSIDGSKAEGDLDFTGTDGETALNAATTTIKTGLGDDTFITGAVTGKVTIETGAGDDEVTLGAADALAAKSTISLGAGDDTLTMKLTALTKDLDLQGGEHTADGGDVLLFNDAATFTAQYESVKGHGFEVIGATGAQGVLTADVSKFGDITNFFANDTAALNLTNMAKGSTVTLAEGAMHANSSFALKTTGALNLVLENVDGDAFTAANNATITASNANAINVHSDFVAGVNATSTTANVLNLIADVNAVVTIEGTQDIIYHHIKTDTTVGDVTQTVNAGTFSGKLTLVGGSAVDTITTGTGTSIITGGAGDDDITLGAGKDTVVFSAVAGNGTDKISSFTISDDVLDIRTAATFNHGSATAGHNKMTSASSTDKVSLVASDWGDAATAYGDRNGVITITDNANATFSNVLDVIGAAVTVTDAVATNGKFFIAVDNGTKTNLYVYTDTSSSAGVLADDIKLVGTLTDVGDCSTLTSDNFIVA